MKDRGKPSSAERHRVIARESYRRVHGVTAKPCSECGAPRDSVRVGRCEPCAVKRRRAVRRARPRKPMTAEQRELHRMRAKAYAVVGPGYAAQLVGSSEAGVSARIRDLRKAKFGGWSVIARRREGTNGQWEYRMQIVPPGTQQILFDARA